MIDFPSLTVLGIREDTEGVFGGGRGELVRRQQASHAEKFMNLSSPRTRNVTMLKRNLPFERDQIFMEQSFEPVTTEY